MKVLVIGATGRTGRHAVRMLLERGDNVTAFVRNPSTITERSDRLRVFHGDARDSAAIGRAVQSQDAVLSALGGGPLRKSDLQEVFMRNLVTAMTVRNIRRLVNRSAWGSGHRSRRLPGFSQRRSGSRGRQGVARWKRAEAVYAP